MLNDPLANTLCKINNAEKVGKTSCQVKPSSKVIVEVLKILKENKYIDNFRVEEDNKGGLIEINLNGSINKTGAIKPRFSVKVNTIEKFEKRYLPAKDFGLIIISTPKGIITHYQCKEKNLGGKLLAYCY
ncbi:MAG: 30S ribosomal protein S8 [Candidatus Nanoarchaeia archaeon]|nr:30S ribosomal protein S8 [Candidatus Nanoarchaeia archaeon]